WAKNLRFKISKLRRALMLQCVKDRLRINLASSTRFFSQFAKNFLDLQLSGEVNLSCVRKIFSSQSAFLHPRLLLGVAICLTGISLALVVFGQNRWNNARPNSPGPGVIVNGSPDVTPTPTPTPSCVPPPPGMVSWWPGDGTANDIGDVKSAAVE